MIKKVSRNEMRLERHKRVRETVKGTHDVPRLCVFRSNMNISAQIIDDETGTTLASASSQTLKLKNGSNVDVQYGDSYKIEIKKDGEWHEINVELNFNSPA